MMRKILTSLTIVLIVNFLVEPILSDGRGIPIVRVSFVLIFVNDLNFVLFLTWFVLF